MKIKHLIFTTFMAVTILLGCPTHILADEASTTITYSPQESEKTVALTNSDDEDESNMLGSIFGGGNALIALALAAGLVVVGGVTYFVRKKGNV